MVENVLFWSTIMGYFVIGLTIRPCQNIHDSPPESRCWSKELAEITDIGRRIELISMDGHFHEISIGLYLQAGDPARFLVHTYSGLEGVADRVAFIRGAMVVLGGMTVDNGLLSLPCGHEHNAAVRRVFLEAGKLSDGPFESRPLETLDKKSGLTIKVESLGDGLYQVGAEGDCKGKERRIKVVANGLAKLGEAVLVEGRDDQVQFPCGHSHDALTGLLLVRAPNVRAIVREQEMAAARGVLSAPSQQ
tara:strand:+ start:929 stop:1672 length:744 start_codon:yes stop_codon:yes gene_type:complete